MAGCLKWMDIQPSSDHRSGGGGLQLARRIIACFMVRDNYIHIYYILILYILHFSPAGYWLGATCKPRLLAQTEWSALWRQLSVLYLMTQNRQYQAVYPEVGELSVEARNFQKGLLSGVFDGYVANTKAGGGAGASLHAMLKLHLFISRFLSLLTANDIYKRYIT